jgi:hypothetical protein
MESTNNFIRIFSGLIHKCNEFVPGFAVLKLF